MSFDAELVEEVEPVLAKAKPEKDKIEITLEAMREDIRILRKAPVPLKPNKAV